MRLTLRTMLAYLDGILEPADREEIGRKIEESEFARQLVQRLRDCAHNSRLSAPKILGKGTGPDPNTVAEYLDNTLAGERVPEFEKLCLDSDVDLAEVAACHQILTMVLGQPADIDMEMKQQMYGVVGHSAATFTEEKATKEHGSEDVPDDLWVKPRRRRKLQVPDYLRDEPGSHWKTYAAAAILLLVIAVALIVALGPLDRTHPMARLLGFGAPAENAPARGEETTKSEAATPGTATENTANAAAEQSTAATKQANAKQAVAVASGDHPTIGTAAAAATGNAGNESSGSGDKTNDEKSAANPTDNANSPSGAATQNPPTENKAASTKAPAEISNPTAPSTTTTDTMPAATPTTNVAVSQQPPPTPNANVPPPLPTPTSTVPPITPPQGMEGRPMPGDMSKPAPEQADMAGAKGTGDAMQPPAAPVKQNVALGRLVPSKGTVLLKFDADAASWVRVPSGEAVTTNEQLLVLPTYRPTITLSSGLTLQIPSETLLEFKPLDARGIPTVKLIYGRLVVLTAGKAGAQIGLDLGESNGVVSFIDPEATLAVEVIRSFPAGANPEIQPPEVTANLYAARGKLEWAPQGGQAIEVGASQILAVGRGATATAAAPNMPKWIEPEQLRLLDLQASDFLAQSLDDKALPVALQEMVENRKVEYKSLGAQCLALLDEFDPLVAAFNDPEERPMWPVEIVSVKAALARGAGAAAKVHEAFVKQHGEAMGKDLYRMFLGYTKEQLQAGEAAKLVEFLDNDSLDCRVLAFANLEELTNKTFNYRPDAPAASRLQPLRRWQAWLEEFRNGTTGLKEAGQK